MEKNRSGVAVVVSGGGARGAYEAGVLSVLLPALEAADPEREERMIFLGSSAGAINAVAFASLSHLSASDASAEALELWRKVRPPSVFRSPLPALRSALSPRGRPGPRRGAALLDNAPLDRSLLRDINWDQLHRNVAAGCASVGVVATSVSTHHSVVFLERAPGVDAPETDVTRSISYLPTTLTPSHVLASAAIPIAFPAIEIDHEGTTDWYIDGGLRLNTPLKPAVDLAAKRIVVLATDPAEPWVEREAGPSWIPTLAGGAAQMAYAILTDRMVEDVRTLARRNSQSTPRGHAGPDAIEWLFAGPPSQSVGVLAELARKHLKGELSGQRHRHAVSRLPRRTLGGWLARDPSRLELATHLMFDPDFIDAAIRRGQDDAARALDKAGAPVWKLTGPVDGNGPRLRLNGAQPNPRPARAQPAAPSFAGATPRRAAERS